MPKTHQAFWTQKFVQNLRRDRRKARQLRALGFQTLTIWECEVESPTKAARIVRRIERFFATKRVDS